MLALLRPNPYWLYGSLSYQQLQVEAVHGVLTRLWLLIIASCGIIASLTYASKLPDILRSMGENTLAIYLLHGFYHYLNQIDHIHINELDAQSGILFIHQHLIMRHFKSKIFIQIDSIHCDAYHPVFTETHAIFLYAVFINADLAE